MSANVETMTYVADRGTPWHGLGKPVEKLMTAREALENGGLDWEVSLEPIVVESSGIVIPNRYASVRSSDGKPLGIVGNRYRVLQNKAAFDWADALVDDGQAKYETAGALKGGAWVFLSMEMNHLEIKVPGDPSDIKTYLFGITSHDCSLANEFHITQVRVVCTNTAELARNGSLRSFRVRHTGSLEGKLEAARAALGIAFTNVETVRALTTVLAKRKMKDGDVDTVYRTLWPAPEKGEVSRNAERAYENYLTSDTLIDIRGTAWGAFNGVTEFLDHLVDYKSKTLPSADVRMDQLMFGGGSDLKDRALGLLIPAGATR